MQILHYNDDGNLYLENIDLTELCRTVSTPFYIYSETEIRNNCKRILHHGELFSLLPCYALKANYNPKIIHIIQTLGFGADVVSDGELQFALRSGISPQKIVFAGVGKSASEIEAAIREEIHSLNIESESELRAIAKISKKLKKNVVVAIRINPDIDAKTHPYISTGLHENKFGVDPATALRMFREASNHQYLKPEGIHIHLGSQIQSPAPYLESIRFILDFREKLLHENIKIKFVDLGGGIGIHYENQLDTRNTSRTFIDDILPQLLAPFRDTDLYLIIELGRAIVGSAGLLITKVLYKKETPQRNFAIIDAAMNNLIRPSLYQAYHQIVPLKDSGAETEVMDIVGPVCETGDYFARQREMPLINEGDYLAVTGAGAYGQVLSSNYNLRPRIAEYLVRDGNITTIFNGESIQTIMQQYL
jgi:diaminopimelate decarboxylase